jgi:glycosyltransferase involved in cell wall biosynthesis
LSARSIVHLLHAWNGRTIAAVASVLAAEMADRGHRVRIVAASEERGGPPPSGVRLDVLGGSGRHTVTTVPAIRRSLRRERPDVVFAHGNGPVRAAVLATRGWRDRPRLIGIEHNHYSSYPWTMKPLRDRLNAALLPRVDVLAGVSAGVVDDLAVAFPRVRPLLCLLPPPLMRHAQLGDMADAPVEHPWFEDPVPVVVTVGHVHPRKDHLTFVRAMAALRDRAGPDVARGIIIGSTDGPEAELVRAEIAAHGLEDQVALLGAEANPLRFVARAEIFALTSRNEGMPVVLLEAMGVGTPIVSTDCSSGPAWLLEGGRLGELVPVGDPLAFAEAVAGLLAAPERRAELEREGRERSAAFAPSAIADGYLAAAGLLAPERSRWATRGPGC